MIQRVLIPLAAVAAALYAYHNSFLGPFIFDDDARIQRNFHIRQLWPPWEPIAQTTRPLVQLSFALNDALSGFDVRSCHALDLVIQGLAGLARGLPAAISVDNGTEFTARAMDHWAYTHRVELDYSRPGKPTDNAFIEAFNSLVRRECSSQHYFSTLEEARHVLATWREEYNNHRPHGSLGDQMPAEYRAGGHDVPG